MRPGLVLVENQRVALLIDKSRWENRMMKAQIQYSPSERSMCVPFLLGGRKQLWVIAKYCHHTPAMHRPETRSEWQWIEQRQQQGCERHALIILGGDFKTYDTSENNRKQPHRRPQDSISLGKEYKDWITAMEMVSTWIPRGYNTA